MIKFSTKWEARSTKRLPRQIIFSLRSATAVLHRPPKVTPHNRRRGSRFKPSSIGREGWSTWWLTKMESYYKSTGKRKMSQASGRAVKVGAKLRISLPQSPGTLSSESISTGGGEIKGMNCQFSTKQTFHSAKPGLPHQRQFKAIDRLRWGMKKPPVNSIF